MSCQTRWIASILLCLVLVISLACSQGVAPTTATKQAVTPSASATPSATPSPTAPSPTAKPATSAAPQVSFAGKTVSLIVPTSPGGGVDIMSRVYGMYLGRFLPGNPTVIVRNMPGGGGTIGGNYVYGAKPDGLTVLVAGSSTLLAAITKSVAAKYDLQRMEAVAADTTGNYYYVKPHIGKKAEDLQKSTEIVFGHMPGSATGWIFIAYMKMMDIKPKKVVLGYSSGGDARRAFFSGEINASGGSTNSYEQEMGPYLAKGEVAPVLQTGIANEKGDIIRDPGLAPDLPTGKEAYEQVYGKPPAGPAWDGYKALVAAGRTYQDPLLLAPGTPEPIVRAYWSAAEKMLQDPAYRKTMASQLGEKAPLWAGEAFSKAFKLNMVMDPKALAWLAAALAELGYAIE